DPDASCVRATPLKADRPALFPQQPDFLATDSGFFLLMSRAGGSLPPRAPPRRPSASWGSVHLRRRHLFKRPLRDLGSKLGDESELVEGLSPKFTNQEFRHPDPVVMDCPFILGCRAAGAIGSPDRGCGGAIGVRSSDPLEQISQDP